MINMILVFGDIEKMSGASFLLLTHLVQISKLYVFIFHKSKVRRLIDSINREEFRPKNQEQYEYLVNDIRSSRLVTILFLFAGFATCALWAIFPFLNKKEKTVKLPLSGWFPFDTTKFPIFEFAFVYQTVGALVNGLGNISIDTFLSGIIMVVSGQLKILNNSLQTLKLDYKAKSRENRQKLIQNVIHHQGIIHFAQEMTGLFTTCIMSQFVVSVIIICITMFQMSLVSPLSLQFLSMALYQTCMITEIFLWCYYGNEIILQSNKLTQSVYMSQWLDFPKEFKKDLLFFMTRSQKPLKLYAGGYFTLSLETFMAIVKSSWSYFAVLNRVHTMKGTVKRFFKINLLIMQLLGFYPPNKYKNIYKIYAYAVYVFLTIPVPTLAGIHLLVTENVDLVQVCDSSFIIFQVGCFIFKLIPFIFIVDKVRESIYMMEWQILNNYTKQQEVIINNCVKICKRNTWLFLGFCVLSVITWASTPFFGSVHKFPITIWLPFDATADTKSYVLVFVFIVLGVGNGAMSNGVIDPLVSGMAYFATVQLRLLKDNLQNLSEYAEEEFVANFSHTRSLINKNDIINYIIYDNIKKCIDHHNAILRFVQYYENVYSSVVFTQFTASVIVVCVSCLQLIMVEPFTFNFFGMITFLLTMLLEIFLYCYFGSTLYEESNSLTNAVCMGKWYNYDLQSKKLLIILMERSKKPIVVTAGKILDLSLVTFTTIIRRAYSLLAVLNNYQ
ncbi:odorant receptor Or1-like [Tribolium madens]|uniref:odorant receptor Or1-like n=1 Tax=Tribolium madens TaxID=41895 RepID=UPI001CF73F5E|nr:odorant receptor Or1-like [Tribolium madens]